jgi:hypothetical protein
LLYTGFSEWQVEKFVQGDIFVVFKLVMNENKYAVRPVFIFSALKLST